MNLDNQVAGSKSSMNGNSAVRAGERAVERAGEALKDRKEIASDALDMATERFNDIVARGQELGKVSAETVRKYPLYSVLGVASVAFLAGLMIRRR